MPPRRRQRPDRVNVNPNAGCGLTIGIATGLFLFVVLLVAVPLLLCTGLWTVGTITNEVAIMSADSQRPDNVLTDDSVPADDARTVHEAYLSNPIAADQNYTNRYIKVRGIVRSIDKNSKGVGVVRLAASAAKYFVPTVACEFHASQFEKLVAVQPGDDIIVLGQCGHDVRGVVLTGCAFEPASAFEQRRRRSEQEKSAAAEKAARELAAVAERKRRDEMAAQRLALRRSVRQVAHFVGDTRPAPDQPEWADASRHEVRQGDVGVRVTRAAFADGRVSLDLHLENYARANSPFRPWSAAVAPDQPVLRTSDNQPLTFERHEQPAQVLVAGSAATDRLTFVDDNADVGPMRLQLPAAAFDGFGLLQIEIPVAMLLPTAGHRGTHAVAGLVRQLQSPNDSIRAAALAGMLRYPAAVRENLAAVAGLLSDPSPAVRAGAREAMTAARPFSTIDASELVRLLHHRDAGVRQFAVEGLAEVGRSSVALAPLLRAADDAEPAVRAAVAFALGKAESAEVISRLDQMLRDEFSAVRVAAVKALGRYRKERGAAAALLAACRDTESEVGSWAARDLALSEALGRSDAKAVAELLTRGPDDRRADYLTVLERPALRDPVAVPALASAMRSAVPAVRARSCRLAASYGQDAKPVVPVVASLLRDGEKSVRLAAASALATLGPLAKAAAADLIAALKDDTTTKPAEDALVQLGSGAADAVIAAVRKSPDHALRLQCLTVLGRIGRPARGVLPELDELARTEPIESVRKAASRAADQVRGGR